MPREHPIIRERFDCKPDAKRAAHCGLTFERFILRVHKEFTLVLNLRDFAESDKNRKFPLTKSGNRRQAKSRVFIEK